MAKSKKTPPKKAAKPKTATITKSELVAAPATHSQPADVQCTFTGGIGQITATLFRKGVLINMQSISSTGTIHFAEVQTGDVISVNGVCTGSALLRISISTTPVTPEQFAKGIIFAAYLIH